MSTYSNLRYIIESMKLAVGKSPFDELVIEAFETILEELKEKQAVPAERAEDACPTCSGKSTRMIPCPDCGTGWAEAHGAGKRTKEEK